MAIFHLHAKHVSRGKGQNLASKSAYNAGTRVRCPRTDRVYNKSSRTDVSHVEILLPRNAPQDLSDRQSLVQAIEGAEKRHDARVAIDIEMSLPRELGPDENLGLIRRFAQQMFVDHGLIVDICVHKLQEDNPHCHLLVATRGLQPDGIFAPVKDRSRENKSWLVMLRREWALAVNLALKEARVAQEISHESYARQGISKLATIHIGPAPKDESQNQVAKRKKRFNRLVTYLNAQRERRPDQSKCSRYNVNQVPQSTLQSRQTILDNPTGLDIRRVRVEQPKIPMQPQPDNLDLINETNLVVQNLLESLTREEHCLLQAEDKELQDAMDDALREEHVSQNKPAP